MAVILFLMSFAIILLFTHILFIALCTLQFAKKYHAKCIIFSSN